MLTVPIAGVAFLVLSASALALSNYLYKIMVAETNRKRADTQQISYFAFGDGIPYAERTSLVKREHERFYPNSRLQHLRVWLNIVGFVCLFAAWSKMIHLW